jgi:hypothetical protein
MRMKRRVSSVQFQATETFRVVLGIAISAVLPPNIVARCEDFPGTRMCAKHQPQQLDAAHGIRTCCGWSFRHSRAPLVAALPRCVFKLNP